MAHTRRGPLAVSNLNRTGPWIALDVGVFRNPKLRKLDPLARLLYIVGLCHCGDELTDGMIEADALPLLWPLVGVTPREGTNLIKQLERASLWTSHPSGWEVNDYLDWNPDRTSWQRRREQNTNRQRAFRVRAKEQAEPPQSNDERNALRDALVTRSEVEVEKTTRGKPVDKSGWVENLNAYTGCKLVRGTHGFSHRYDVLGTDRPPVGWPHERPSREEIAGALAEGSGSPVEELAVELGRRLSA